MFCTNCGHQNTLGSNFCSSCGEVLESPPGEPNTVTLQIDMSADAETIEVNIADTPSGGVLVVKRGSNAGSRFLLEKDVIQAGRHPESDIFLDDVTVSRRHVQLVREGSGYRVRDQGSLNGTYLNHERVEDAPLNGGDELQIGKFKLIYIEGGA